MMENKKIKVLFDFLTFEDKYINGGALFTKNILTTLLNEGVTIYGFCSNYEMINSDIKVLVDKHHINITTDFNNLNQFIKENEISLFYIGISQRYNQYNLTSIRTKIILTCHDIGDIVLDTILKNVEIINKHSKLLNKKNNFIRFIKYIIKKIIRYKENMSLVDKYGYSNFAKLIKQENVYITTVSEYSKNAINFYFKDVKNEIKMFYPPLLHTISNNNPSKEIIEITKNKKFFLLLSADRINKNVFTFIEQFDYFNQKHNNEYHAIILGLSKKNTLTTTFIDKVSNADMQYLFKNCYTLVYPSLNEGFGLPPIEAMQHAKPVIVAYDTSIKEVCGDAAIYFNPLYVEDLYMAEEQLINKYEYYAERSKNHYSKIVNKINDDSLALINYIKDIAKNG